MVVVTGATGQLGQLVVEELLAKGMQPGEVIAAVRSPEKAKSLQSRGVQVRRADFEQPGTLVEAFAGAERVLLISSNAIGARVAQHQAAVDGAKAAGVRLFAYTSILNADWASNLLAKEHRATEIYLQESGLTYVLLRNGWYTENHTAGLGAAIEHGAILGAAGNGRFASAARRDYAEAAVAVLMGEGHKNQIYELGGDPAHSMQEFADEASRQTGKTILYRNLPAAEYAVALVGFGLPKIDADAVADADASTLRGELTTDKRDLQTLLGRASTPWTETVAAALAG